VTEGLLADFPTTSRVVVVALVAEETTAVECAMPASAIAATAADSATRRVVRIPDTLAPTTVAEELAFAMPSREESGGDSCRFSHGGGIHVDRIPICIHVQFAFSCGRIRVSMISSQSSSRSMALKWMSQPEKLCSSK
jgi:hypothetical protein